MNEKQWEKWRSPEGDPEWEALFALRGTLLRSLTDPEFRDLCSPLQRI
jgi:hypothetical protein